MDKEWSDRNKEVQKLIANSKTYKEGINKLIELRADLFKQVKQIFDNYPERALSEMPYLTANGFHNKSIVYSLWHIIRIEDITVHELITKDEQILFQNNSLKKINSPIITTGNELKGLEIKEFSQKLNCKELLNYAKEVMESTNSILLSLTYKDLKRIFDETDVQRLIDSKCVSEDEEAFWLIEYWCSKDVTGLIRMPYSRHWIMHIEAMRRIKNRLCAIARKNVDPIAYCGLSCNHCFLSEWCGSCRTEYNVCSFATISENHVCENVKCCKENNLDGCYECEKLIECTKGFYVPTNSGANAAKAQAMYIRKYGKKEFLKTRDRLDEKREFKKTQEILGQDMYKGLKILEEI